MYGIILIGMQGSGKSTVGQRYASTHDIDYISSGNIARAMAAGDSNINAALNRGEMAPEDMMRQSVRDTIQYQIDNNIPFILDGFPRFVDQNNWLHRQFNKDQIEYIYIEIWAGVDECIRRVTERGRPDDILGIDKRMTFYRTDTYPILDRHSYARISTNGYTIDKNVEDIHRYVNSRKI